MHFTQEQLAVTHHPDGHAKVIAVAGSGKTSTLIGHIEQLLNKGVDHRRMLILMYNKSAQLDFQARIQKQAQNSEQRRQQPEIRTFHSLGLRLYQSMVSQGAIPPPTSWKPMSRAQIDGHIMTLLRQYAPKSVLQQQSASDFKEQLVEPMLAFMEFCSSKLQSPAKVFELLGLEPGQRYFIDVLEAFEHKRKEAGLITFADMLRAPVIAMKEDPSLAQSFSDHMDHILVDEFQDIDDIQAELLSLLAGSRAKVMVIGDPDQCIYSFRGAQIDHILFGFDQRFRQAEHYPISHTYRYGPQLALLANHLIANNHSRTEILCVSSASAKNTEVHLSASDDEGRLIIEQIKHYHSEGVALNEMVIIVRLWAQAANIELELLQHHIPYSTESPYSIFKREEIETLTLFLQWPEIAQLGTKERERYITAALQYPRLKIKQQPLKKAIVALARHWNQMAPESILKQTGLNPWEVRQINERLQLLQHLHNRHVNAGKILSAYARDTDLIEWLEDNAATAEGGTQRATLTSTFIGYCQRHKLAPGAMIQHLQELKCNLQNVDADALTISSIHKAKGLEWPIVFIPGLSRKYVPYLPPKRFSSPGGAESERRLLYVAITRAKQHLHLYTPTKNPSPFIAEMKFETSKAYGQALAGNIGTKRIDAQKLPFATPLIRQYANSVGVEIAGAAEQDTTPQDQQDTSVIHLQTGVQLSHKSFGSGRITSVADGKFTVKFDSGKSVTFPHSSAQKFFH